MSNASTDEELLAALRARVTDASNRVDTQVVPIMPRCPPASPEIVTSTERDLGFSLNPFLKRIYLEVANGGFGPGYGLVSLTKNVCSDQTLSSLYHSFRTHRWPDKLLPLWDWGDAIWSCIN